MPEVVTEGGPLRVLASPTSVLTSAPLSARFKQTKPAISSQHANCHAFSIMNDCAL